MMWTEAEEAGFGFHKDKTTGTFYCNLQLSVGSCAEAAARFSSVLQSKCNGHKLQQGKFYLNVRRKKKKKVLQEQSLKWSSEISMFWRFQNLPGVRYDQPGHTLKLSLLWGGGWASNSGYSHSVLWFYSHYFVHQHAPYSYFIHCLL